jgi:hypothetical protein
MLSLYNLLLEFKSLNKDAILLIIGAVAGGIIGWNMVGDPPPPPTREVLCAPEREDLGKVREALLETDKSLRRCSGILGAASVAPDQPCSERVRKAVLACSEFYEGKK